MHVPGTKAALSGSGLRSSDRRGYSPPDVHDQEGNTYMSTMRFAINPLQWLAQPSGGLDFSAAPPLPRLLAAIKEAGFKAIAISQPKDGDWQAYADALRAAAIVPAPGYLSGPLEDPAAQDQLVVAAEALARAHVEFGLSEMFVASGMVPDGPRVQRPAQGVDRDERRLSRIAETLRRIGEVTARLGVTACLHQHVGTWIEVEPEVEWLLEHVDAELLSLGPDTGHLAWAGTDPVQFIAHHAARVRALHVKDLHVAVAEQHKRRHDAPYRAVVAAGLWAEPGRGDLDLHGALAALPADFSGWATIEVDQPDLPTPQESARACADWVQTLAEGTSSDRGR
jgi:inosose dehydratase